MSYFNGKSQINNYVILSPKHRKNELLLEFINEDEAREYYRKFNYEKENISILHKMKIKLCNHSKMYDLDVGSNHFHYKYCPNCKIAIYINDESTEDKNERLQLLWKNAHYNEIKDLYEKIEELKINYKDKYEEEFQQKIGFIAKV